MDNKVILSDGEDRSGLPVEFQILAVVRPVPRWLEDDLGLPPTPPTPATTISPVFQVTAAPPYLSELLDKAALSGNQNGL